MWLMIDLYIIGPLLAPYARPTAGDTSHFHQGTVRLFNNITAQVHAPAFRRLLADWIIQPRIRLLTALLRFHPPAPASIPKLRTFNVFRRLIEVETLNRKNGSKRPLSTIGPRPGPTVDELYGRKQTGLDENLRPTT